MLLQEYEKEHNQYIRENSAECTVLLKKDGCFPLEKPCKIAVYGSGVRNTVKGGTGSGEVNSRYFVNVEQGLLSAGFEITTESWLNGYEKVKSDAKKRFMADVRKEARQKHTLSILVAMGRSVPEPEYELPIEGMCDTAIYVLSRISGEGSDRAAISGEIFLTETEKRDILLCNEKYKNFMLVLNVGGVVDLSDVSHVKNILLLSQLGVETGNVLADILLGKSFPSGKLTTTWDKFSEYPEIEFGDKDITRYKEGIYVGYRYYATIGKKPLFPFGYGLSYADFEIEHLGIALIKSKVCERVKVTNTGNYAGKEVVQLYVTIPQVKLDQPYKVLAGFAKTKLLLPGEAEELVIEYSMEDIASFDVEIPGYVLETGDYIHHIGTNSESTRIVGIVKLEENITVKKTEHIVAAPDFVDVVYDSKVKEEIPDGVSVLIANPKDFDSCVINYEVDEQIEEWIEKISDEQLIKLNLGAFDEKDGLKSMIGTAGLSVAGAAGQTSIESSRYGIPSMVMADGPAGLRLSQNYVIDNNGKASTIGNSLPDSFIDFLPKVFVGFMKLTSYKPKRKDVILHQYATAIPIGTAIAQSFNLDLAEKCGDIVGSEMELFGVHLWLAPALNIHRSIMCGRNYEYFSEDPLVSGEMAAAITRGVQTHPGCGTTIKHFACNNQELNRTQNNSEMSERTLRDIYLKGFGIAVKKSQPKAVMTSYNLVNGIHSGESKKLIDGYLRCENNYKGIVMTDWVIANYANNKDSVYPVSVPSKVIMAGGDLFMPGSKDDYKEVEKALSEGNVTRRQLMINATRVAKMARDLVH